MATDIKMMQRIHRKLSEVIIQELEFYLSEEAQGMPLPSSDKAAIAKFLKDNNITVDPADKTDLETLREQFMRAQEPAGKTRLAERLEEISAEDVMQIYGRH